MLSRAFLLAILPASTLAHFQLNWPKNRGFSDDTAAQYPCGGFNTIEAVRQAVPLDSPFPIQLNMEHTSVHGEVVLALGNAPTGGDFSILLKPTFLETGPDSFCIGGVTIPASANVTEGMNATLQVLTNGDPSGGLYQCADITFTKGALSLTDYNSHCINSSGVSASFSGGAAPNGTGSAPSSSSSGASASAGGASSASSSAFAPQKTAAGFLLGAAGLIGGLAVL